MLRKLKHWLKHSKQKLNELRKKLQDLAIHSKLKLNELWHTKGKLYTSALVAPCFVFCSGSATFIEKSKWFTVILDIGRCPMSANETALHPSNNV